MHDINVFKTSNVGALWNNWMTLVLHTDYMNVAVSNFTKDNSSFLFTYKVVYHNYTIYYYIIICFTDLKTILPT